MKIRIKRRTAARIVTWLLPLVALQGCYSYRGGNVPVVAPSSITAAKGDRVVAYYVRVESNVGDDDKIEETAVKELVEALGLAGGEARPKGTVRDADIALDVTVEATGSIAGQLLSGFVSGFTFTLIPAYARVDFTTTAQAVANDLPPRNYAYNDSCTLWIQLFLLPVTNLQEKVVENLIADMMRSLVRDLQQDGLLPSPVVPAPQGTTGIGQDSVALCHQVATLERAKLADRIDTCLARR